MDVTVADDFGPQILGIPVLQLTEALYGKHDPDISRPHHGKGSSKIGSVFRTSNAAHIVKLIQYQIDGHVAAAVRATVGIASQFDEHE